MHELFRLTEELPIAPGKSPFHIRGLYYDRLLHRAKGLPGGLPSVFARIKDERVRDFMGQRFTWSGWYDVLPSMPLHVAIADLRGQDFETAVREGTRASARGLIPWMFGTALRALGPAVDAARVAKTVMHIVNFTRIDVGEFREGYATASGSGIPLVVAPSIANLALGFYEGVLESRGARDIHARYTDVNVDGHFGDLETVTVRYEFSWTPKRP